MPEVKSSENGGKDNSSVTKAGDSSLSDAWPMVAVIVAFTVFISSNIGLTEFNSWALKEDQWPGFHFAFFYTMFHALVSFLFSYCLSVCVVKPDLGPPSFEQLWKYKLAVVPMALCTTINNGLNNASLSMVSLFVNQSIKAILPAPVMLFSCLLAGSRFKAPRIATVLIICVGSVLASYYKISMSHTTNSVLGVFVCTVSMLGGAFRPVIAMMFMKDSPTHPKLHPTVFLCYDTGLSFIMMTTLWVADWKGCTESIAYMADPNTTGVGIAIILTGSAIAFFFNLSQYYAIKLSSALTITIGSAVVKITLLIASAVQAEVDDPVSWSGVGIVVIAIVAYSFISYTEKPDAPSKDAKQAAAPSEKTPLNVKP